MSALPDLRLQATPEVKSKAKPPAKEPEPRKNEASSFADVYARERQSKPDERAGGPEKADREQSSEPAAQPSEAAGNAAEQPGVATAGNFLPSEATPEALDPLLAMALGGAQVTSEETSAVSTQLPPAALVITGLPVGDSTAEMPVPEPEGLDPLSALQPQPEQEAKVHVAQETLGKAARPSGTLDFAAAMAAMGKDEAFGKADDEPALELSLESFAKDTLESLQDSVQPNRPDQFVSKLNALTQALNQQVGMASRLPLVPGQPVAMHQGGWSEAVVDRVMWLSSQNLKSAEIQLDPAELGRLEVRVNLSQDQAQVTFASPNAGVRDALEGQMHRLRELFAQQGMSLADANVSDQSLGRGWQGQGEGGRSGGNAGNGLLAADDGLPVGVQEIRSERLSVGRGLVDYYA